MVSIYIHIPFCERICNYCDFPKRVVKTKQINDYLIALEKEIKMYNIPDKVDTLYIGGGTPSILNGEQLLILKRILSLFKFNNHYEFTIECNPEHITKEKVEMFKKMGVNRISLGVQTFNDRLLRLLNRNHNKDVVYNSIKIIKNANINNINIDLMYAIPMQTIFNVKEDIKIASDLGINHISAYSLILEEKTVFDKMIADKKIKLLDNEIEAEMYQIYIDSLTKIGFDHYEISNFAKKNYHSIHNKTYWKNLEYFGFGMGASGYLDNIRYYNENMLDKYVMKINKGNFPIMSKDLIQTVDKIKEELMLGLRLREGIDIKQINKKYNIDILKYFEKEFKELFSKKYIIIDGRIKLSNLGLFFGNDVFMMFI